MSSISCSVHRFTSSSGFTKNPQVMVEPLAKLSRILWNQLQHGSSAWDACGKCLNWNVLFSSRTHHISIVITAVPGDSFIIAPVWWWLRDANSAISACAMLDEFNCPASHSLSWPSVTIVLDRNSKRIRSSAIMLIYSRVKPAARNRQRMVSAVATFVLQLQLLWSEIDDVDIAFCLSVNVSSTKHASENAKNKKMIPHVIFNN